MIPNQQRACANDRDLHYDALLLSGLINGLTQLSSDGFTEEATACMEIACRLSRQLVDDLEEIDGILNARRAV